MNRKVRFSCRFQYEYNLDCFPRREKMSVCLWWKMELKRLVMHLMVETGSTFRAKFQICSDPGTMLVSIFILCDPTVEDMVTSCPGGRKGVSSCTYLYARTL